MGCSILVKTLITHKEVIMRIIKTAGLIALLLALGAGNIQMAYAGVESGPLHLPSTSWGPWSIH